MELHREDYEEEQVAPPVIEKTVSVSPVAAKDYNQPLVPTPFSEDSLPVHLNQPLIESTRRLKDERDVVRGRFEKMENHRDQVSESVYAKVKADYAAKYRELAEAYAQKKQAIDAELEKLYEATRELSLVLEKHRGELEEAKFRHFLGEFSDQKYKAVEKREEKEIYRHEQVLEKLQGYIDQYEALLVPEDDMLVKVAAESKPKASAPKKVVAMTEGNPRGTRAPAKEASISSGINLLKRSVAQVPSIDTSVSKREPVSTQHPDFSAKTDNHIVAPSQKAALAPVRKSESVPYIQEEESIADILSSIPLEAQSFEPREVLKALEDSSYGKSGKAKRVSEEASDDEAEAETTPAAVTAKVSVIETGGEPINFTELALDKQAYIGRLPANSIVLPSAKVSRRHAQIALRDGEYVIVDLESSNGVYVNGSRVKESLLRDGDTIGIGRYRLRFELTQ